MDRVAIVARCWFAFFIAFGCAVGSVLFSTPWTGGVTGFGFALLTSLAWPKPEPINAWMGDQPA
jgi:hypothetical protein